ncbi:DUF5677 domain-containing protein [Deefgea rivuli]|uniref:DUF5677 domain-containing protein n=1 Tax=Deefgea rivuli TaxID=400948 RepID=UPI000483052E|nr:DUF5677 domain-containing protein [Deefgea rivuli]
MKNIIDKISEVRNMCEAHLSQIPPLKIIVEQLDAAISILIPKMETLPFFLKANVDFNLYALADLNKSLVEMLESNRSCTVEALSRVASEQAVNLIYVIGGNADERAKSLISSYVTEATKKTLLWLKFSEAHKKNSSVQSARQKLEHLQYWREQFDLSLRFKGVKPWLSAFDRFSAVGAEELYRTVFASSSDAIHGFPDDIFNSTTLNYLPEVTREDAFKSYLAEKKSFAVFLTLCAIGLYVNAIHSLALKLEIPDLAEELMGKIEVVNSMITTHENDLSHAMSMP